MSATDIEEMGRRLNAALKSWGVSLRQMDAEYRVTHGLPDQNPMPWIRLLRTRGMTT